MGIRTTALVGVAFLVALVSGSHAATIRVPEDEATIAAGLHAAAAGDTVVVACGTYYEHGISLKAGVSLTSASGLADCVTVDAQHLDRVFWCEGVSIPARLTGFTVVHGYPQDDNLGGGGMYCADSDLAIENCIFAWNRAGRGAGMRCDSGASPAITGCLFLENSPGFHCPFGGGMECSPGAAPNMSDVEFVGNLVLDSGAGMWCDGASPVLVDVDFIDNWAYNEDGGGMFCEFESSPTLLNVMFAGNRAVDGGGLYCQECTSFSVEGCTFFGNTADRSGGALYMRKGSSPSVESTSIVGNSAIHGSGLLCFGDSHPMLSNCIIAFGETAEAVYCFPDGGCSATLSCCDVFGNAGGDWVDCIADQYGILGNFTGDPLFCDMSAGDLTLHADSPCAPEQSGACGLIGAWGEGCDPTPVEARSWGSIKARYK